MTSKLERIRAQLQENQNENQTSQQTNTRNDAVYPFWNMGEGDKSVLRFLPDGNEKNDLFWVERNMLKLEFPGVKGQTPKPITIQVPCVEMWGDRCPVLDHIRKEGWFKDPDLEDLGRKYWKKRSWIFQGFVVQDGIGEESPPENPIRRFIIGRQIFELIRSGVLDPEFEESPDDYEKGVDFQIIVQKKPGTSYNDYTTSKWSRKPRPLNDDELQAIETYGLNDLNDFLPKKPTDKELEDIYSLFEASYNGEFYDPEKFGHLPWTPNIGSGNTEKPQSSEPKNESTPKSAPKEEKEEPKESEAPQTNESTESNDSGSGSKQSADDILAKIRAKKSQ